MASRYLKLAYATVVGIAFSFLSFSAVAQEEDDLNSLICKDVMILSGSDRDTTIAFIHGYLLGKSGSSKVDDLDKLTDTTEAFLNKTLDEPNAKAVATMESLSTQ